MLGPFAGPQVCCCSPSSPTSSTRIRVVPCLASILKTAAALFSDVTLSLKAQNSAASLHPGNKTPAQSAECFHACADVPLPSAVGSSRDTSQGHLAEQKHPASLSPQELLKDLKSLKAARGGCYTQDRCTVSQHHKQHQRRSQHLFRLPLPPGRKQKHRLFSVLSHFGKSHAHPGTSSQPWHPAAGRGNE